MIYSIHKDGFTQNSGQQIIEIPDSVSTRVIVNIRKKIKAQRKWEGHGNGPVVKFIPTAFDKLFINSFLQCPLSPLFSSSYGPCRAFSLKQGELLSHCHLNEYISTIVPCNWNICLGQYMQGFIAWIYLLSRIPVRFQE